MPGISMAGLGFPEFATWGSNSPQIQKQKVMVIEISFFFFAMSQYKNLIGINLILCADSFICKYNLEDVHAHHFEMKENVY